MKLHAQKRLKERYGLDLTEAEYRSLGKKIRRGKAEFIKRQSLRVTHWNVDFKDQKIRVVYDKIRHQVITALPLETAPKTIEKLVQESLKSLEQYESLI